MITAGCDVNSCLNGGTCVAYSATERWCNPVQSGQTCCQCVTGYTGYRCENGNIGSFYSLFFYFIFLKIFNSKKLMNVFQIHVKMEEYVKIWLTLTDVPVRQVLLEPIARVS